MHNRVFSLARQCMQQTRMLVHSHKVAIAICILMCLDACQTSGPVMTLEEAKDVVISMNQIPLEPPPRRLNDVLLILDQHGDFDSVAVRQLHAQADKKKPAGGNAYSLVIFYRKRANARINLGRLREGRQDLRTAYRYAMEAGIADSRLMVGLGRMELAAGNYERAIALVKNAIEITPDIGSSPDGAYYALLARIYHCLGDFTSARANLSKAHSLHDAKPRGARVGQRGLQSVLFQTEAELLEAQGRFAEAHEARSMVLNQRYSARKKRPLPAIEARLFLALNLKKQGRLVEAEKEARQALQEALGVSGKISSTTAATLYALGEVMLAQGRPDDAVKLSKAQIEILDKLGVTNHEDLMIKAKVFAGDVLCTTYQFKEAMEQYDLAKKGVGNNRYFFRKHIAQNTSIIISLLKTGRLDEAMELIAFSDAIFDQIGSKKHPGSFEILALRGMAYEQAQNRRLAFNDFSAAMPAILEYNRGPKRDYTKIRRAGIIVEAYLALLMDIRESHLEQEFEIKVAEEVFRMAEAMQDSKVQAALGESSARAAAIRDAELSDLVRREQDALKKINALQATLTNAIAAPPDQQDPKSIQTLEQSINSLQQARLALLERIKGKFSRYAEFTNPQPARFTQIQKHLTTGEAMLLIWTVTDRTYVWAIPHRGEITFSSVPLGYEKLKQAVASLRRALEPTAETFGDIPDFDLHRSYDLYRKLLMPVEKGWKQATDLLVVVHGPLGQLPLAVLPTLPVELPAEKAALFGRYRNVPWLIRKVSITRLPAASSLVALRSIPKGDSQRKAFVGFGDPIFNPEQLAAVSSDTLTPQPVSRSGKIHIRGIRVTHNGALDSTRILSSQLEHLNRLPDTAEEIVSIAGALGADLDLDIYLGKQATEDRVKTMDLSNRKVVAFATHALVPGDLDGLDQPALAFCSPSISAGAEDGLLTMGEILMLKMNADWVVLSACNTAAADGAGVEAISGLGRAFFYAGTRAVLVSMWPVETTSARKLVTKLFYFQQIKANVSRAQALQESIFNLIDGPGLIDKRTGKVVVSYAHPIFWAPFIIVGDSNVILAEES